MEVSSGCEYFWKYDPYCMVIQLSFLQFFSSQLRVSLCSVTDMARTRGAGSQLESRTRPTASVRRGDRGPSFSATPVSGQEVVMLVRW